MRDPLLRLYLARHVGIGDAEQRMRKTAGPLFVVRPSPSASFTQFAKGVAALLALIMVCALMIPTARATFTATNTNAGGHFVASTDWYTTAVVASGPWDYWRLGEASGNAVASIVSPTHNGTYSGAVTYGVSGATADGNKAVTFPGTRYLTVANSTSALTFGDVFTSEAWVKLSSTTNYRAVMGKGSNNFAMEIEPNNTFHMAKNGAMPFLAVSTATISTGVWHHIAATKNGAAIHLYLDGVDVTSTPTTNLSMANNTKPLQIGADGDNGTVFTGSIDEPAFYTTELSAAQIALHYQRG